jgi:competence protein ComEA
MTASRTVVSRLGSALLAAVFLACALGAQAQTQTNKTPVDVNSANTAALQTLPGIGPTLAQRIIEGRPYQGPADLEKVKGLSKSKVATLKGQIVFGPSTPAKAAKSTTSATVAETKRAAGTNATAAPPAATQQKSTAKTGQAKTTPETASTAVQDKGAPTASPSTSSKAAAKLAPGQKININKASFKDLDLLPGIGPTKAQAIIDYRTQQGPFKSIEDIQKVKGIKAESFSKIKDYIKVSD